MPSPIDPPLSHAEVGSIMMGLVLALLLGALDQTIVAVSLLPVILASPVREQPLRGRALPAKT